MFSRSHRSRLVFAARYRLEDPFAFKSTRPIRLLLLGAGARLTATASIPLRFVAASYIVVVAVKWSGSRCGQPVLGPAERCCGPLGWSNRAKKTRDRRVDEASPAMFISEERRKRGRLSGLTILSANRRADRRLRATYG